MTACSPCCGQGCKGFHHILLASEDAVGRAHTDKFQEASCLYEPRTHIVGSSYGKKRSLREWMNLRKGEAVNNRQDASAMQ